MNEPPSPQLLRLLRELRICSPAELRRCGRRVRHLAGELPTFDSVWIDALVQARKLTPFQAKILESPQPERLRVGPCVLLARLGEGLHAATYLARQRDGRERCVLKLIDVPAETAAESLASVRELLAKASELSHPSIVVPHACRRLENRLVVLSRYVLGPHLGELMIRRGRFAPHVVAALAHQLIDGLAELEARHLVHGGIHLHNVRLTDSGRAVLVDAGLSPALAPELTIHSESPPDRYDGIAAELIGTGNRPDSVSDIYALGCLLWQLLAGRPPFPTGDPLDKLVAHQTRAILDVREWAPDTPAVLADEIARFTSHRPEDRPQTFAEIRQRWGPPRRTARKRVAAFRAMFDTAAPRMPTGASQAAAGRWKFLTASVLLLAGTAVTLLHQGARNELLQLPARIAGSTRDAATKPALAETPAIGTQSEAERNDEVSANRPATTTAKLRPLPPPDEDGVILLDSDGLYAASDVSTAGRVVIRGAAERRPTIQLSEQPLRVAAGQLRVEHVRFRMARSTAQATPSAGTTTLLLVQTQNLAVLNCRFESETFDDRAGPSRSSSSPSMPAAIAWKLLDAGDRRGGVVVIENSVFSHGGPAVHLADSPRNLQVANCLKLGTGPFLELKPTAHTGGDIPIALSRLTLRESGALLRLHAPSRGNSPRVVMTAGDCLFDVAGPNTALFEWVGRSAPPGWPMLLEMTGEGSIAGPGLKLAGLIDSADGTFNELDSSELELEGIVIGAFDYRGAFGPNPGDSAVISARAPRRSSRPPGIDAGLLEVRD